MLASDFEEDIMRSIALFNHGKFKDHWIQCNILVKTKEEVSLILFVFNGF